MTPNEEWGLTGKVAIITGGGAVGDGIGNGRAAAILMARAGAHVLVVDRNLSFAERTVAMIAAEGGSAVAASYDVTVAAQCAAMVDDAMHRWGRLDCLDNNVGIGGPKMTVVQETEASWANIMHANVDSVFLVCRAAIPAMIKSGGGSIVNISSVSALRPHGITAYSTSKGAVHALTQSLAVDHGPDHIRVNCVVPGPMYTPVVYANGMTPEAREARRRASVLGLEGTGWDVGMAVRFLLSPQARYITGQILCVDGGITLVGPEREVSSLPYKDR
jgi:NAD(P)-dependent dehydrogenase (short-subunit alcohol dehydrogenase family)